MIIIDLILITTVIPNFSVGTPITPSDDVFQNLHLTLLTIEEKLTNLESFVMIQCGTRINGKLDYYGRKIDNIEKTLSKLEVHAKVELEKITENINTKNFKEDINKDRIIRNIDSVYEKINHKLIGMQGQTDVTNLKIKNIGETILGKLEKIEDTSTVRDSDMEAELNDVVAVIDDLKTTCVNMEEHSVSLARKSSERILNGSQELKNHYKQLEVNTKNMSESITYMQDAFDFLLNQTANNTETIATVKSDVLENLNEYANKFADIHSNLWHKTDSLDLKLQQMMNITTLNRNELQNNLRALMIQFGRLSGKENVQNDYNNKLDELNKKVDANFQDVLLTQNLFLESCHRVQMDEAQIESQISVVLNKLIDIFENKTSINANDIKHLEYMIRAHDSNMKRNVQNVVTNLKELLQKILKENGQMKSNFNDQKQNLEIVHILLRDILNSKNPTLLETISRTIQNLQKIIEEPQTETHNNTMQLLSDIQHEVTQQNSINLNISNVIQNINFALSNIENKINNYLLNNNNAEEIATALSQHLQKLFKPNPNVAQLSNISDLITEIFGKPANTDTSVIILDEQLHKSDTRKKETENAILQCKLKTVNCKKIYNSTYGVIKNNDSDYTVLNCLSHYIDLIDVRYTTDDMWNCTMIKSSEKKCFPNYVELIDMRFNTNDFKKCVEEEILPYYLDIIDVRFESDTNNSETKPSLVTNTSFKTEDNSNEAFHVNLMTVNVKKDDSLQQEPVTWNESREQELTTTQQSIKV